MKKRLILVISLILILGAAIYGTVAYLSTDIVAHNVITVGNVRIKLLDQTLEGGEPVDFPEEGLRVMPGASAAKLVSIENTGASACWVRIKVEKNITPAGEITAEELDVDDDVILNIADMPQWETEDGWILGGDGYYYYQLPLEPGETTPYLFTAVNFDIGMGNQYQGCTLDVVVTAYAVQAANNTPAGGVLSTVGWPSDD